MFLLHCDTKLNTVLRAVWSGQPWSRSNHCVLGFKPWQYEYNKVLRFSQHTWTSLHRWDRVFCPAICPLTTGPFANISDMKSCQRFLIHGSGYERGRQRRSWGGLDGPWKKITENEHCGDLRCWFHSDLGKSDTSGALFSCVSTCARTGAERRCIPFHGRSDLHQVNCR